MLFPSRIKVLTVINNDVTPLVTFLFAFDSALHVATALKCYVDSLLIIIHITEGKVDKYSCVNNSIL